MPLNSNSNITSIYWHSSKPSNPAHGDTYFDENNMCCNTYDSQLGQWIILANNSQHEYVENKIPTEDELEKYPSLKEAWEEYLIIKKIIGK